MKKKNLFYLLLTVAVITPVAVGIASSKKLYSNSFASDCLHTHVEHHAEVAPSLWNSGVKEYWCCCECHKSFKNSALTEVFENTSSVPTSSSDSRYAARLGEELDYNFTKGSVSSEAAPEGFSKVYEKSDGQMNDFLKANEYINSFERIAFRAKSATNWFIIRNCWDYAYGSNSWKKFELVQTSDNVWDIYSADPEGTFVKKVGDVSGRTLTDVMQFGGATDTFYITNLRVIKAGVTGEVIDSCATTNNDPVLTANTTYRVPAGFTSVTDFAIEETKGADYMHGIYYSAADLSAYSEVRFAINTTGYFIFNHGWDGNEGQPNKWFFFTLTNKGNYTWDLIVEKQDGTTHCSEQNLSGNYTGTDSYTKNSLNAILSGCTSGFYPSHQKGVLLVVSSTEVRGTRIPAENEFIDSNLITGNGATTTKSTFNAPIGFDACRDYDANTTKDGARVEGKYYSDVDLSAYSEVRFALRTTVWFLFNHGWESNYAGPDQWFFFYLTNKGNYTWDLVVKNADGSDRYSENGLNGYLANPGEYTNNSLNAILFGCCSRFEVWGKTDVNLVITTTEIRGIRIPATGEVIDTCAISSNDAVTTVSSKLAPIGFETARDYDCHTTTGTFHGKFYSAADLSDYSEVRFALNTTGWFLFNHGWNSDIGGPNKWFFFTLTNKGNYTWDLVVTLADGSVQYSEENLSGNYTGDYTDVYSQNALNTILYGNPSGFYASYVKDVNLVVTVTELRGTLA